MKEVLLLSVSTTELATVLSTAIDSEAATEVLPPEILITVSVINQ